MGDTRFEANRSTFDDMAVGPEIRAVLLEVAKKGKTEAESLAAEFAVTGDYAKSFEITSDTVTLSNHRRAAAILQNTSDHSAAVEWGNANDHKPHRVLGRVAATLGDG